MQNFLEEIKNGAPISKLFFRQGDAFQEVADSLNETLDVIQEERKQDFMYLSEVNSYLKNLEVVLPEDKKVVLQEINQKLSDIQNRFN
jgi:gluconate kinase